MFGDYPSSMRERVGDRLPKFSAAESSLLKGSLDFVGINHYTTYYARNNKTNIIGFLLNDALADSGTITLRKLNISYSAYPKISATFLISKVPNIKLIFSHFSIWS